MPKAEERENFERVRDLLTRGMRWNEDDQCWEDVGRRPSAAFVARLVEDVESGEEDG